MSAWRTEKHFVSWLGLCPDHRSSGGKVLKPGPRKVVSRAATAFRVAASTLRRSQSALGAKYRGLQSRLGPAKAITAMAHHLARLFYRLVKYGSQYVDSRYGGIRSKVQGAAVQMAFQEGRRTAVPLNSHRSSSRLKFLESSGQSESPRPQSRFRDTPQTSRGKLNRLRRTTAGFTTSSLDGCGLRSFLPARPLP